ncbi:matrixin family metalloprotease [Solicola gregarius]|uniref:Matrixin family metalloprotease n=1 Tax=Solicola gregarius TaxID=2908642 RepID=A0AA46TMI4_9ACTN|nr:matrixin family metalloprotease [Solicola gregarius]UYM07667.1 matrixin family metalloprotease [Solicola gregarius]
MTVELRARRATVAIPAVLALSAGLLGAASADDPQDSEVSASANARKSKGYNILSKDEGYPYIARWNPCQKIHYKINARKSPRAGFVKDTLKAVKRLHRASGLRFTYQGRTKTVPNIHSPKRYKGKTDLVIAWTTPKKRQVLKNLGGWGGGYWWRVSKRTGKFTKGWVLLNSKYRYKYPKGFGKGPRGGYGTRGQLLMHELGHSMGLAHVERRSEIMFHYTYRRKAKWGNGDRKGLRKVGQPAGCIRSKAPNSAPVRSANPHEYADQG